MVMGVGDEVKVFGCSYGVLMCMDWVGESRCVVE